MPWKGHDKAQQDLPVKKSNGILHGNVDYFKEQLQYLLRSTLDGPNAWYLHALTGTDYSRQITAEGRIEETDKLGKTRLVWKRIRRDNHFLDCEVMQLAAAEWMALRSVAQDTPKAKPASAITRRDGRKWLER